MAIKSRRTVTFTEGQNDFIEQESERLGIADWQLIRAVFSLGLEAYQKDGNIDINFQEQESIDSSPHIADIDLKKIMGLLYAILFAVSFSAEGQAWAGGNLLFKNGYKYDDVESKQVLSFIVGNHWDSYAYLWEKIGEITAENGGDVFNAIWEYFEGNGFERDAFLNVADLEWQSFNEPVKNRAIVRNRGHVFNKHPERENVGNAMDSGENNG